MRRTQLYLDDDVWSAIHARARSQRTTISKLVRDAVRERYLGRREEQMKAMQAFVGIRKDDESSGDATESVRELRRSGRMNRLDRLERVRKR